MGLHRGIYVVLGRAEDEVLKGTVFVRAGRPTSNWILTVNAWSCQRLVLHFSLVLTRIAATADAELRDSRPWTEEA